MKSLQLALIAAAALAATSTAQPTSVGGWKAIFVGAPASRPKVPTFIQFDLQRDGQRLSGTVHAEKWPGDGVISEGAIEGNHVTFTTVMEQGSWRTGSGGVLVDHCCPKFIFDGTIDGDKMTLNLKWTSTEVTDGSGPTHPMEATRIRR